MNEKHYLLSALITLLFVFSGCVILDSPYVYDYGRYFLWAWMAMGVDLVLCDFTEQYRPL